MFLFNKHTDAPVASAARPWLPKPPCEFTDVVGMDFGKQGCATFSTATGESVVHPPEEFVSLWSALPRGSLVVVEYAHFQVFQTYRNIAQPLKVEQYWEIRRIAAERDITIRIAFQTITPSMRACVGEDDRFPSVFGGKDTDTNDAMAIALYVANVNDIALMLPMDDFERSPQRVHFDRVVMAGNNLLSAVATYSISATYDCRERYPDLFDVVDKATDMLESATAAYMSEKGVFAVACLMLGYHRDTGRLSRFTHGGRRYGRDAFSKFAIGNRAPRKGSGKCRATLNNLRFKTNAGPKARALNDAGLSHKGKCSASADPAVRAAGKAAWRDARRMQKETWAAIDRVTKDFPNLDI